MYRNAFPPSGEGSAESQSQPTLVPSGMSPSLCLLDPSTREDTKNKIYLLMNMWGEQETTRFIQILCHLGRKGIDPMDDIALLVPTVARKYTGQIRLDYTLTKRKNHVLP